MEVLWFAILLSVVCVYFVLDGYDFGVGVIHLFLPKKEKEKKLIAKSAGLFWDFNEVWLVVAGGILFMAFPKYYASVFSGFYLPLIILLWLMIFRAIGLELRHQFNHPVWTTFWDKSFGISSLLLAFFSGSALGNIVRGVNMGHEIEGVSTYEPHYFFLPLWNSSFSPFRPDVGVLDWFTVNLGLIALVMLTIHGGNWIILKTNSTLIPKIKSLIFKLSFVLLALLILSLFSWKNINEDAYQSFLESPWIMVFPMLFVVGFFIQFSVNKINNPLIPFLGSSIMIISGICATFMAMFPTILPSINQTHPDLTIYNTANSAYGFQVATVWVVVGITLAIIYFLIQHRILAGKIDDKEH